MAASCSDSIAAKRLGGAAFAAAVGLHPLPLPRFHAEFASILNQLHDTVGDRRVYVANFIDGMEPGAAYFLADLKPAPTNLEPFTMVMNQDLLASSCATSRATYLTSRRSWPSSRTSPRCGCRGRVPELPPNRDCAGLTWGSITVLRAARAPREQRGDQGPEQLERELEDPREHRDRNRGGRRHHRGERQRNPRPPLAARPPGTTMRGAIGTVPTENAPTTSTRSPAPTG